MRENTKTMFLASLVISPVVAHGPQTIVGLTRTAFNAVHPPIKGRQLKQGWFKERQLPINSTKNSSFWIRWARFGDTLHWWLMRMPLTGIILQSSSTCRWRGMQHLLSTTIKMVKIAAIIKTTIMVASLRMIQSNVPSLGTLLWPRGSSCCHDLPDLIS